MRSVAYSPLRALLAFPTIRAFRFPILNLACRPHRPATAAAQPLPLLHHPRPTWAFLVDPGLSFSYPSLPVYPDVARLGRDAPVVNTPSPPAV